MNYWKNMKSSLHNLEGAEGGDFARKLNGNLVFQKGSKNIKFFFKSTCKLEYVLVQSRSVPSSFRFVPPTNSPLSKSSLFSPKIPISTTYESDSSFSSPHIRIKKLKLRSRKNKISQFSDETESPFQYTDSNFDVENIRRFSTPNIQIKKSFWLRAFCCVGK